MDYLNGLVVPALVTGALYALVALGFNVLDRTTRVLNFAHGDLIMIAPMGAVVAVNLWGLPAPLAIVIGVVAAVVLGLLVEFAAFRPFIGSSNSVSWILGGLAASVLIEQLATEPFGATPQTMTISLPIRAQQLGPLTVSPQSILLVVTAILCVALVWVFYRKTSVGRLLRAVGEDSEGAEALGVSKVRAAQIAMVVSALLAAIAGLLSAPLLLVSPDFGFNLTFVGFIAVAIGGSGSIPGSLVGGLIIGALQQATAVFLGAGWTHIVAFGALLLLYLIRPWGLFGSRPLRTV